jgi:sucrose-6-phosphate hydrolase SacC (GH32 family)
MTLYVGFDETREGRKTTRHTIHFLTSPNLKEWTVTSRLEGFYECPDLFELPVDGDATKSKWVLTGASSEYMIGRFDGEQFTPETPKLPGHRGKGFYAAQTFSDIPPSDGRRLQFGWLQAPSPGMPFNQCMSLPLELSLRTTPEGPRLAMNPAKELGTIETSTHGAGFSVRPGDEKSLTDVDRTAPLKIIAAFEPGPDSELKLTIDGVPVVFHAAKQELTVNGHRAPAPLRNGRQQITIYADRTALEVFASDGLTYVPMPVLAKTQEQRITVSLQGSPLKSQGLEVIPLKSIW